MGTTFLQTQSLTMSRDWVRDMASQIPAAAAGLSGIVSTIPPINGNNAATLGDAVDLRLWQKVVFHLVVGVIDEVVDFEIQESETSGGSYDTVPGKVATQINATTGDGKAVQIEVSLGDLTEDHFWVKPEVTVGNGTSSLVAVVGVGYGPLGGLVSATDLADVLEILPTVSGLKARFYTNTVVPSPDRAYGDFTLAAITSGINVDTLTGPSNGGSGSQLLTQLLSVTAGPDPTEETIKGVILYRTVDGTETLVAQEAFAQDVAIAQEGDKLEYLLTISTKSLLPVAA